MCQPAINDDLATVQDGCNTSAGLAGMPYHACRLYNMPECMLVPPVHERGAWIKRLVGELSLIS